MVIVWFWTFAVVSIQAPILDSPGSQRVDLLLGLTKDGRIKVWRRKSVCPSLSTGSTGTHASGCKLTGTRAGGTRAGTSTSTSPSPPITQHHRRRQSPFAPPTMEIPHYVPVVIALLCALISALTLDQHDRVVVLWTLTLFLVLLLITIALIRSSYQRELETQHRRMISESQDDHWAEEQRAREQLHLQHVQHEREAAPAPQKAAEPTALFVERESAPIKKPQSLSHEGPVVRPLPETPAGPPTTPSTSRRHGKSSVDVTHTDPDKKVASTAEAQDVGTSPPSPSEPQDIIPHVPELHTNPWGSEFGGSQDNKALCYPQPASTTRCEPSPDAQKFSGAEKGPIEPDNCYANETVQDDQQSTIMPAFSDIAKTSSIVVNEARDRCSPPPVAPAPSTISIASGETEYKPGSYFGF
ncbi:hypothetical protein HDK64DRAFT_258514 [Phyllosticta capitalensis]